MADTTDRVTELERQIAKLQNELERERSRTESALEELTESQLQDAQSGVAKGPVFGRPALTDAAAVAKRIVDAILDLQVLAKEKGFGAVKLKASGDILRDLALLGIAPPRGENQAGRRDHVTLWFTDYARLKQLAEDREGRVVALDLCFGELNIALVQSCFRRVFERASERSEDPALRRS